MSPSEADRRSHLESEPATEGIGRLRGSLGWSSLAVVRRLGGGVSAATHLLDGDGGRLVLKRFMSGEQELARLEQDRLGVALAADVPTPAPIAVDLDGAWFGAPALVMSAIEGECLLRPDADWWYVELAVALAAVHRTPVATPAPDALRHPTLLSAWRAWVDPPDDRSSATAEAVRALQARAGHHSRALSHGDYHPGNVLFVGERLTGVVDWNAATVGPAASDVAQCRTDLAIWAGDSAPDRFLAAYRDETGDPVEDLSAWEVLHGDHALRHGRGWIPGFVEAGIAVTADQLRERVEAFIDDALARRDAP